MLSLPLGQLHKFVALDHVAPSTLHVHISLFNISRLKYELIGHNIHEPLYNRTRSFGQSQSDMQTHKLLILCVLYGQSHVPVLPDHVALTVVHWQLLDAST